VEKRPKLRTFIDLFAGIGGFRIALESFGLKCVFGSEWDKPSQKTYSENFCEIPAGDITKIKENEIPPHDILCAGFPCQAFSISGKQGGFKDTRGTLFFDIARVTEYRKPKVLFLENVKNFVRHDKGKTLATILRILKELDYDVYYEILNASHYGVPQSRERVYIVGFRKDLGIKFFEFPHPTFEKVYLKDIIQNDADENEYVVKRTDIKFWDKSQKPSLHPIQIGMINKGGQGERIYSIEGHAVTLSAYGGGIASKTGAYLINGKIRRLTPRECARVQGFPDSFKLPATKAQAYKQFGNSVPVPVVKAIMKEILDTLSFKGGFRLTQQIYAN
jgi:DNA (cytosine-5)-methyltransferase 1